jgi:hypothetical protein
MQSTKLCTPACLGVMLESIIAWVSGALIEKKEQNILEGITENDQCLLLAVQSRICDRYEWDYPCWSTLRPKKIHNAPENEIMSIWASSSSQHYNLLLAYAEAILNVIAHDEGPNHLFRKLVTELKQTPPALAIANTAYDLPSYMRMQKLFETTGVCIPMLTESVHNMSSIPICGIVPFTSLRKMNVGTQAATGEGWSVADSRDALVVSRSFAMYKDHIINGIWQLDRVASRNASNYTLTQPDAHTASQWAMEEVIAYIRTDLKKFTHMIQYIETNQLDARQLSDQSNPCELCAQLGGGKDVLPFLAAIQRRLLS